MTYVNGYLFLLHIWLLVDINLKDNRSNVQHTPNMCSYLFSQQGPVVHPLQLMPMCRSCWERARVSTSSHLEISSGPFPGSPPHLGLSQCLMWSCCCQMLIQPLKSFDKFHELSGWQNEGQLCSEDEAFENREFQMAL